MIESREAVAYGIGARKNVENAIPSPDGLVGPNDRFADRERAGREFQYERRLGVMIETGFFDEAELAKRRCRCAGILIPSNDEVGVCRLIALGRVIHRRTAAGKHGDGSRMLQGRADRKTNLYER